MRCLLIFIPIIIILLLIIPIEFNISYEYVSEKSRLNITTSYLFGLFKPEIYPFDKEKKARFSKNRLTDRIKSIHRDYHYKKFLNAIWGKLVIKKINWETVVGFKDAYLVGTISGMFWFLKSLIFSFLLSKKEVKNLSYSVVPKFNENKLEIQIDCIIKIRMVYIITVWIWILKLNKGGEKIGRASNRRFNENYDE